MSRRNVSPRAMRRMLASLDAQGTLLDQGTADRLLQGRLPVDDAPPRYRGVAQALALVGGDATQAELVGKDAAVAAISARIQPDSARGVAVRTPPMRKGRVAQLVAMSTIGVASLFSGLAAANALPDSAQRVVSDVLSNVGVHVPSPDNNASPNDNASPHVVTATQSDTHASEQSPDGAGNGITTAASGEDSTVATTTPATSTTAAPIGSAVGEPPNQQGIDTSTAASAGRSAAGLANANEHSNADTAHANNDARDKP